jgi:hypothetical protein
MKMAVSTKVSGKTTSVMVKVLKSIRMAINTTVPTWTTNLTVKELMNGSTVNPMMVNGSWVAKMDSEYGKE